MRRCGLPALIALCALAACGGGPSQAVTSYARPQTPGAVMCIDQCRKSQDYCRENCNLDTRACINNVQANAQQDYDAYVRSRFTARLPVVLTPSSFEHSETCQPEKTSCSNACTSAYNDCYRACGGTVTIQSSCRFLCFE